MGDRWDKCKCGIRMYWDPHEDGDEVVCRKCGTKYGVDCDTIMVYWLEEKVEKPKPHRTDARR